MSVNLSLVSLEPSLAQKLQSNPSLSDEIEIEPSRDDILESLGFKIERTLGEDEYPNDRLELGKDWHLLHQLFTQGDDRRLLRFLKPSEVNSFLASGGKPIGEGSGYGPARLFSAQECGYIDTFLEGFGASSAIEDLTINFVVRSDVRTAASRLIDDEGPLRPVVGEIHFIPAAPP